MTRSYTIRVTTDHADAEEIVAAAADRLAADLGDDARVLAASDDTVLTVHGLDEDT